MKLPRTLLRLYLAATLIVTLLLVSAPAPTYASSPPDGAGQAFYVQSSWHNTVTFNGQNVLYAYQVGYNARYIGTSLKPILLAFGRQVKDSTLAGGWGVKLVGSSKVSNTWVKEVAQAFYNGYSAGHTQTAIIAIGTSNANYNWTCNNGNPSTLSPDWKTAGQKWAEVIAGVTAPTYVYRRAANDIESWYGTSGFGSWVACGLGAEAWFDGYEEYILGNWTYVTNFGSNGNVEYSPQWTIQQVYDVMHGRSTALGYPQIFCSGQTTGWVNIQSYSYLSFTGVTSENAHSTICTGSTRTYTWDGSWTALHNALNSAGYLDFVGHYVTSFYYP